ncbi:MAG: dihydropteroate synthase [Proteobacteria bacterium]|nr:dihydropteroate synthase [Pseudomonadota bacterium]
MNASSPSDRAWQGIHDGARIYLRRLTALPGATSSVDQFELIVATAAQETRMRLCRADLEDGACRVGGAPQERISALLARADAVRGPVCGLGMDRPRIMGVLNITPDSFSDGGENFDCGTAIAAAMDMREAGADIIDVGGVSTRPGSRAPSEAEELDRVMPVIAALTGDGLIVSVDTRRAAVMAAALDAGAKIINDISALTADPDSLDVAARFAAPVILMHMQGTPKTMQEAPVYDHVALDIFDYLEGRIEACEAAGIARRRLIIDPGIGFGKTMAHNLQILRDVGLFHALGCPLLIGLSRKYFISRLSAGEAAGARVPGSIAGALHAISQGVQIVRVHDVRETVQAIKVWQAIRGDMSGMEST